MDIDCPNDLWGILRGDNCLKSKKFASKVKKFKYMEVNYN